jgi:hypothetical protein
MKIDRSDLTFELAVGSRNRVAIYNHMRGLLFDNIVSRGFRAKDPELFNQLTIEQRAMELTDRAIAQAEFEMQGYVSICQTINDILDIATSSLTEVIDLTASEFLADENSGLMWLIHEASGVAPMTPSGGFSLDLCMKSTGPDRDREGDVERS